MKELYHLNGIHIFGYSIIDLKKKKYVKVHIRHLREKLGDTVDEAKYIKTIWGVGYKI